MILPSAVTYGRIWVPTLKSAQLRVLPFWNETYRVERHVSAEYQKAFAEMFLFNKPIPLGLVKDTETAPLADLIDWKSTWTPLRTGPEDHL